MKPTKTTKDKIGKPLRFAALIRVSTEKQAEKGESLRTQAAQIEKAVEDLGGVIVKRYAGQEHATSGWEREQLERLLSDAARTPRPFDAVIVADQSRWSRDNVASEQGLERLRDAGVRFFVMRVEYDLNNDDSRLFLAITTTFNAHQARQSVRKSLDNRIAMVKRGVPASGTLPYGRTFDKKSEEWGVDPKAKALMEEVAKRYIAGESVAKLGEELGVKETTLYDRLEKCGSKLLVEFKSPKLNISESIEMQIPALLDAKTIKAIRKTAEANRTFKHGESKYRYLLRRVTFCALCGSSMSGQTCFGGRIRYYRHLTETPLQKGCPHSGMIPADELEDLVIRHLFQAFGNPKAVQKAIEDATPNSEKLDDLRKRYTRITDSLKKIDDGRQRVISLVGDDMISDEDAKRKLVDLGDRKSKQQFELDRISEELGHQPDKEAIKAAADRLAKSFNGRNYASAKARAQKSHANRSLDNMTWEDRRELIELVFSGKLPDGHRMGVFVKRAEDGKRWCYTILGHLFDDGGRFPLTAERKNAIFEFGGAQKQGELLTQHGVVRKPGPWRREE